MSVRTKIEDLKNILLHKGLEPRFDKCKNRSQKLEVNCPSHGIFYTNSALIKRGNGCRKCGRIVYAQKRRGKIEVIAAKAEELGVKLLSTEFPNIHGSQELTFECQKHGVFTQDSRQLMYGRGCSKCGHARGGIKNRKCPMVFLEEIKKIRPEYTLKGSYIDNSTKIEVVCSSHGSFFTIPSDLLGGHGCPKCGNRCLKTQSAIADLLKNCGLQVEENSRMVIKPSELDIYVPSKNFAIEYCGLYWHTENTKDKNYHLSKLLKCKEKGIELLTIFEDEWLNREEQVKSYILAKMGQHPKLYARNCEIIELDPKTAKTFLDSHIQGAPRFLHAWGLVYENEVVGCITINKHHRNNQELVINRVCFSKYQIIGGASRLIKAAVKRAKELGYNHIITWSDNRWSNGKMYEACGFSKDTEYKPDYSYVFGKRNRVSKQSCQKKNLVKKGATGATEREMAESLGYKRIWDCGKIKWVLRF